MSEVIDEAVYRRYLVALLDGDGERCAGIVQELVVKDVPLKTLYTGLFQRSLYQIGELWEQQQISVAVEHLATAITERMLGIVQTQVLSGPARKYTIVIACVAGEYHQIGARMNADFCELLGWRAHFLGANTPLPDLLQMIADCRPALLGLSVSVAANLPTLWKALDALGSGFPLLPVLVGGQAFRWGALDALEGYPNVSYIGSLDALEERMQAYER